MNRNRILWLVVVLLLIASGAALSYSRRTNTPVGPGPRALATASESDAALTGVSVVALDSPSATTLPSSSFVAAALDAQPDVPFDRFAAREAIEASLAAKDVSALPALERTDLAQDGYVAAAAIDAVGKLAAIAPEPAKGEAVRTLARWLTQETNRQSNDAVGNVSILVESLADTKSPEAITPLISALDSGSYPLEVQTSIVQSLDLLDARAAAPSLERYVARLQASSPTDELQRDLAKEGAAAARAVLAKWAASP